MKTSLFRADALRLSIIGLTLGGFAHAQHPGSGIAKYTMSVSEPLVALDWAFGAGWPIIDCRTAGDGGLFFHSA